MLDAFPDFDGLDLASLHADADFDGMPDSVDGSLDFDHDTMTDFYDGHLDGDGNGLTDHADPMFANYVESMSMPDPFGGPEPTIDSLRADADFDGMPDLADGSFDFDHDGMNDSFDGAIDVDANGFVDHADPMVTNYVDSMTQADGSTSAMAGADVPMAEAGASTPDVAAAADPMAAGSADATAVPEATAAAVGVPASAGVQGAAV